MIKIKQKSKAVTFQAKTVESKEIKMEPADFTGPIFTIEIDPMVCFTEENSVFTISHLNQITKITRNDFLFIISVITKYFKHIINVDASYHIDEQHLWSYLVNIFEQNPTALVQILEFTTENNLKEDLFDRIYEPLLVYKVFGLPYETPTVLKALATLETITTKHIDSLQEDDVQLFFKTFSTLFLEMSPYGIIPKMITALVYASIFHKPLEFSIRDMEMKKTDGKELMYEFDEEDLFKNVVLSNYKHYLLTTETISLRFYSCLINTNLCQTLNKIPNSELKIDDLQNKIIYSFEKFRFPFFPLLKRKSHVDNINELEKTIAKFYSQAYAEKKQKFIEVMEQNMKKLQTIYPILFGYNNLLPDIYPFIFVVNRPRVFALLNIYASALNSYSNLLQSQIGKKDGNDISAELADTIKTITKQIIVTPLLTNKTEYKFISEKSQKVLFAFVKNLMASGSLTNLLESSRDILNKKN